MHIEIAIGEFPKGSQPLISTGTRGARSRGVGIRHFGVLGGERLTTGEVAISRNAITTWCVK
jgi:hypothetical protein